MIRWKVYTELQTKAWLDILECSRDERVFEEILYEAEYGDTDGFEHKVQ
jgi:hypothetical protein